MNELINIHLRLESALYKYSQMVEIFSGRGKQLYRQKTAFLSVEFQIVDMSGIYSIHNFIILIANAIASSPS